MVATTDQSTCIVHNSSYGAGVAKKFKTLTLSGVKVTYEEVEEYHNAYWDLFKGIKQYESTLLREQESTGGWMFDLLGIPNCVDQDKKQDIINKQIQRSGHSVWMKFIRIVYKMIEDHNWTPEQFYFIMVDFYDETCFATKGIDHALVNDRIQKCTNLLNAELKCTIPIKTDGGVMANLWEAKS